MVTISSWLLFVAAALYVLGFIAVIANIGAFSDVYEEAFQGTDAEGGEGFAVGAIVGGSGFFLLLAVGLVLLGIFNNQGRNGSRITTWVIGGLAVCCTGVGFALSGATAGFETEGGPDQAEIERMLSDTLPGWYESLTLATSIIALLALIAALILLMLPAANEFFRKRPPEEVFEPPSYPPPPAPGPGQG